MPFKAGNTLGGRKLGSKNAMTKEVKEELLKYLHSSIPDMIDCISGMKREQRFKAYVEIANLVLPKERAIDMTLDNKILKQPIVIELNGAEPTESELREL